MKSLASIVKININQSGVYQRHCIPINYWVDDDGVKHIQIKMQKDKYINRSIKYRKNKKNSRRHQVRHGMG